MKTQVEVAANPSDSLPVASGIRLPRKWPVEVRSGDCVVKIYKTPTVTRGKRYDAFTLSYFAAGQRQRRQFTDYARAKSEADRIAEQKAQGALGAAALSASDRLALQEALTTLAKNEGTSQGTMRRLVEVVRDYATARAKLPAGATMTEAAEFFAARHSSSAPRKTVEEAVAEFIADRTSAGCSEVHLRDLRVRLGQFAHAFALPISAVNPPLVQQWIYGLRRGDRKPASARSKKNMLRNICALFNFARRMKYLAAESAMEMAEIRAPKGATQHIEVYSPAELRTLLNAADADLIPALAIGAFAGLRLAELARLNWREIKLAERLIVVDASKAKTAARRLVPISDTLAAWLAPHSRASGSVSGCIDATERDGHALGNRLLRTAARAEVQWKRNGFRHSYISYRVATLKDVPAVALECGNSPAIIFSHYRALASEAEGKAWFDVTPPQPAGNVLVMPKAASE